jgi:hypothetical protein
MLMKLTTVVNFINVLQAAFACQSRKSKKDSQKMLVFFCAFQIWTCKSCSSNVAEIETSWGRFQQTFFAEQKVTATQLLVKNSLLLFAHQAQNFIA